jgi:hypothetical protein
MHKQAAKDLRALLYAIVDAWDRKVWTVLARAVNDARTYLRRHKADE